MNKIILAIILSCAFCSCSGIFEKPKPMVLSKSEAVFGPEGGVDTIVCLNYAKWWISGAQVTGSDDLANDYAWPTDNSKRIILGKFSAVIINNSAVRIKVEPSDSTKDWTMSMESGDARTKIRIYQNK